MRSRASAAAGHANSAAEIRTDTDADLARWRGELPMSTRRPGPPGACRQWSATQV